MFYRLVMTLSAVYYTTTWCYFLADLEALCKKLHSKISQSESDKYDLEVKLASQEAEVDQKQNLFVFCHPTVSQCLSFIINMRFNV